MEAERDKKLINFSSKSLEMEEDRVSKLPNEILHHILSKVDMKEAVQTSILSKRWKNIWSSLPNLSFSFRSLAQQSGVNLSWSHHNDSFMPRFTNIVTRFLSHRDDSSSIHKFQLSSSHMASSDSRFVEKCLHYAINHGVQHLELDAFCRPALVKFPDGFFSSKTLRVLKLKQYTRTIFIPKPFILVNLKTLYLECFTFKDDDGGDDDIHSFSKEPFSSFPNLEKLTLDCCEFSDLIISASKLKMLEISFSGPFFSREKKIEKISTPELSSFRYKGYVSLVCSKVVFPSLEEVYIDIVPVLESPYTDDIKKKMPENLVRILQQLGRAKFVTLTLSTIDVLQMDLHLLEHSPSPFPYIESLSLTNEPYMIHPMKTVPKPVMNYLTKGSPYRDSLVLKFPEGIFL